MKTITLGDFLTEEQIALALKLHPDVSLIQAEVVEPNMKEINRKTSQENDARYLAYAIVYAISQAET
jgi:hypothetical protein